MSSNGKRGYTQANLLNFFEKLLPPQESNARDKLIYHYPARRQPINHFLLSITATDGIYERLTKNTCLFLHPPWALERHRVPVGCLVVSSHFRFDETMTVGYNPYLASQLGCDHQGLSTIAGYKNDPDRRIGTLSMLRESQSVASLKDRLASIFELDMLDSANETADSPTKAIAIMNAFNEEQVDQVAQHFSGDLDAGVPTSQILYITGEPRPTGSERAEALGMPVVFIGHRAAEAWGIRRLAQLLQEAFPDCGVETSFEPEPEPEPKPKSVPRQKPEKEETVEG